MAEAENKVQTPKEFLDEIIHEAPLYSKRIFHGDIKRSDLRLLPATNFFCKGDCDSSQTFKSMLVTRIENDEWFSKPELTEVTKLPLNSAIISGLVVPGEMFNVYYQCAKCQKYIHSFFLKFDRDGVSRKRVFTVQKIGQDPAVEQSIDRELKIWLSKEDEILFQKGLRSEANGFGIAAYSYYRRIIEGNIERLLKELSEQTDSADLKKAITAALKQTNAADRADLVKNHVPASLSPDGQNVFSILYRALSAGIHSRSDEECLADAADIKVCLMFLIKRISREKREAAELASSIKALSQNQYK